jgi:ketosteroid isomerase-like protein
MTDMHEGAAAEEIRLLVEERVIAVRERDVDGATRIEAPGLLLFDVVDPLQSSGTVLSRKRTEDWFASFDGPIGYEIRDLKISASEDVGFSHGLYHVNGVTTSGIPIDMWWRGTVCYEKIGRSWKATHEHNSVPCDPATGKASMDLKP